VAQRIAASMSLIAFATCLLVGGLQTGNTFGTTVQRALVAMVVTLFVGLVVGAMAQRMIEENLRSQREKTKDNQNKTGPDDR
jgi:uncharacterized membrane protein YfcA